MAHLVTAPLVLAKDEAGRVRYHYNGAVITDLSEIQAAHFTKLGLVEHVDDDAVAEQSAPPVVTVTVLDRPLNTATEDEWRQYAISAHGVTPEDAAKVSRKDLIELYGG